MGEGPKDLRDDAARDPRTRYEGGSAPTGDDITGRPLTDLDRPGAAETVGYAGGMAPAVPMTGDTGRFGDDNASTSTDTAAIRADIEQTRANISDTVDAIQQKLSPSTMVSQAADSMRDATRERMRQVADVAGDTANRVADTTRQVSNRAVGVARENPWATAAAVAGVGALAWWLTSRRSSDVDDFDYEYDDELLDDVSEESLYYDDFDTEEGRGLMDKMRGNAVPLVVAGVGLGWWLYSRQSGRRATNGSGYAAETYDRSWTEAEGYGADAGSYRSFDRSPDWSETASDTASKAANRVKGAVSSAADRARDAVSGAGERARGVMADAGDRAKHVVDDMGTRTRQYANRASSQVGDATRKAGTQLSYWMDRNPLAVGAAAMVLGAAVGMALPESRREQQFMGDARDRLVDRAQNLAGDAMDRAKQKVQEVANKATDAMNQANTSGANTDPARGTGLGQNPR